MARKVLVKETKRSAASQIPVQSAPTVEEIKKDIQSTNKEVDLQAVVDGATEIIDVENKDLTPEQRTAKLDALIPVYHEENGLKNLYTNSCKKMGNDIKELLMAGALKTYITGSGVQATISITPNVDFNEEALLAYCKTLNIPGLVKTKEFVDMDVLEDAIYHKDIDPAKLKPFQEEKPATVRLTTKIPKKVIKG